MLWHVGNCCRIHWCNRTSNFIMKNCSSKRVPFMPHRLFNYFNIHQLFTRHSQHCSYTSIIVKWYIFMFILCPYVQLLATCMWLLQLVFCLFFKHRVTMYIHTYNIKCSFSMVFAHICIQSRGNTEKLLQRKWSNW